MILEWHYLDFPSAMHILYVSYNQPVGGEMASTGTRKLKTACRGHRVHDKKR